VVSAIVVVPTGRPYKQRLGLTVAGLSRDGGQGECYKGKG
jgi:hypothetical protein